MIFVRESTGMLCIIESSELLMTVSFLVIHLKLILFIAITNVPLQCTFLFYINFYNVHMYR